MRIRLAHPNPDVNARPAMRAWLDRLEEAFNTEEMIMLRSQLERDLIDYGVCASMGKRHIPISDLMDILRHPGEL